MDEAIKIGVHAPAEGGKANKALVKCLATLLDVPNGAVSILSGEKGRTKRISVIGITAAEASDKLT